MLARMSRAVTESGFDCLPLTRPQPGHPLASHRPFVAADMHEGRKINVAVLGATGTVGQRFIALLSEHPFFVLRALGASQRSAGKPYARAVTWKQTKYMPAMVREMIVQECKPELFVGCEIVFSGLDADVAGPIGTSAAFCVGFAIC